MQNVPEKEIMGHIADLFKGFADPTRVHILSLLMVHPELCVTEIAEAYNAMDGVAKTRLLFKYEQEGDKGRWVRLAPISDRTAEILLSNDADPEMVKYLKTDPSGQKGAKP